MKRNLHRAPADKRTPAFGREPVNDPDAARPLKLNMPESHQYTIPLHIVFTHDSAAQPAQIPWLEEIRSDQFLSDLHSEVI